MVVTSAKLLTRSPTRIWFKLAASGPTLIMYLFPSGPRSVTLRLGDGSRGWPEEAPFDRIIVTAAAPAVPAALRDQLGEQGVLVAPVGDDRSQIVRRYRKQGSEFDVEDIEAVRFVPLIEGPES